MIETLNRRQLLALGPLLLGLLSGCIPEAGSGESLTLYLMDASKKDGEYEIVVQPRVGVGGDWEPFRNVSVLAATKEGEIVCREFIGDITESGDQEPITLTCTGFPYEIYFEIERDPCSERIHLNKLVYNDSIEDWSPEGIDC